MCALHQQSHYLNMLVVDTVPHPYLIVWKQGTPLLAMIRAISHWPWDPTSPSRSHNCDPPSNFCRRRLGWSALSLRAFVI